MSKGIQQVIAGLVLVGGCSLIKAVANKAAAEDEKPIMTNMLCNIGTFTGALDVVFGTAKVIGEMMVGND